MKKILFSLMFVGSLSLFSQQLISFETSEGYTVGDVNGQNGWTVTGTGATPPAPAFVTGQVISTEQAVGGTKSLKVAEEPTFGPQTAGPVIGAFYTLPTATAATNFTISFDTRINQQDNNSSDWVYRGLTVGAATNTLVYYLNFSYDGTVNAATILPAAPSASIAATTATWLPNVWYRVKIVGTATAIEYYIDNVLVYTGSQLSATPGNLNRMDYISDNYGGDNFIDRVAINNEAALGTNEVQTKNVKFSLYPNPTSDILNIKTDEKIKAAFITDMVGRKMDVKLNGNAVDVSSLQTGNYLISVETTKGKTTEKFIKK